GRPPRPTPTRRTAREPTTPRLLPIGRLVALRVRLPRPAATVWPWFNGSFCATRHDQALLVAAPQSCRDPRTRSSREQARARRTSVPRGRAVDVAIPPLCGHSSVEAPRLAGEPAAQVQEERPARGDRQLRRAFQRGGVWAWFEQLLDDEARVAQGSGVGLQRPVEPDEGHTQATPLHFLVDPML